MPTFQSEILLALADSRLAYAVVHAGHGKVHLAKIPTLEKPPLWFTSARNRSLWQLRIRDR